MIESLPHSLWYVGSETAEQLTLWHPSVDPLPAPAPRLADLERWVNEGGRGDDPDLRLSEGTETISPDVSGDDRR